MNRANLKILAEYLAGDTLKIRFDSRSLVSPNYTRYATCGCQLVHAALLFGKPDTESWPEFAKRVCDLDWASVDFLDMFAGDTGKAANCSKVAAAKIYAKLLAALFGEKGKIK